MIVYGDLRLTETVGLARLVEEELSTQVTSLSQDVKHLTEEVNEFAKQSIPSLLGILLTGQMLFCTMSILYFKSIQRIKIII